MLDNINLVQILLGLLGGLALAYLNRLIGGSEKGDVELKKLIDEIIKNRALDNEKCGDLVAGMTGRINKLENTVVQYYALKVELRQHEQETSQRLERIFTEIKEQSHKTQEAFAAINHTVGSINVSQARLEGQITSAFGTNQSKP